MLLATHALISTAHNSDSAFADQITVSYSGNIFNSDIPGIAAGAPFIGSFTYDEPGYGIPPGNPSGANLVGYFQGAPGDSITMIVEHGRGDDFVFLAVPNPVPNPHLNPGFIMTVEEGPDAYLPSANGLVNGVVGVGASSQNDENVILATNDHVQQLSFLGISTAIYGNSNFLQSTALPNPFDVQDVFIGNNGPSAAVVFMTDGASLFAAIGYINSIQSATPVPEPSTLWCQGLKALYRSWAIPCAGVKVYSSRYRSGWLEQLSEAGVRRALPGRGAWMKPTFA